MKRIVVLGAAESGVGAALLAQAKGYDVFVSDLGTIAEKYKQQLIDNHIPFEEQQHTEALILNADEVVKSPGIPDKAAIIKKLRAQQTPVIAELEFAARFTKAKFVAITGSNGKTTTTLLTYHLLRTAGFNVGLAGNIGDSLAKQVIADTYDYYVLEVSSFQLDGMYNFKADVGVLLNITPDHLDRYEYVMQLYVDSKFRMAQNMGNAEYFITFADSQVIQTELEKRNLPTNVALISLEKELSQGAYLGSNQLVFNLPKQGHFTIPLSKLALQGPHNYLNAMAAVLAVTLVGAKPEQFVEGLQTFKNAAHRLEAVATINEILFINDSKATNVDSVKYALESFDKPIVLIAGGVDKGNDYNHIMDLVKAKVKTLVCMGKDNTPLHDAFDGVVPHIIDTNAIGDAVTKAFESASPGDVVLLSPACASFDLFKNYEDRGEQFKSVVHKLQHAVQNI